jgi:hypothetical protein
MMVAPLIGRLSDCVRAGPLGGIDTGITIISLLLIAQMPADPIYFIVA